MKKAVLITAFAAVLCAAAARGATGQPLKVTYLSVPESAFEINRHSETQQMEITAPKGNVDTYSHIQGQLMEGNFYNSSSIFQDYSYIKLPPIEILFEYARNNSKTDYYNQRRIEAEQDLKSVRRQWLRFLNVNASYRYGFIAASTDQSNRNTPDLWMSYYDQKQSWWSAGVNFTLPFDEIFDRRNRVNKQRTRMEQATYEAETWYEQRKLDIIDSYAEAGMNLALIRIKSETATISAQDYIMAQADFINGRVSVQQLSYSKSTQNDAATEYEQTRALLYKSILRLETLSNYKILNK